MKRHRIYIIISIVIVLIILGISIGYSAFNTASMVKDIAANVRVPSDIRVTDFSVDSSLNDGISTYTDYSITGVQAGVTLPKENSSVKYKVKVTNFEGPEMGIFTIVGLPDNLKYELSDYSLKQKICDSNDKCTLGVSKEFYITISYNSGQYNSSNTTFDIKLNFDFRQFYSISYVNISDSSYPTSVIEGDSFSITLPSVNHLVDAISRSDGTVLEENTDYIYSNNNLTVNSVDADLTISIEIAKSLDDKIFEDYEPDLSTPSFSANVTSKADSGLFSAIDESGNKSYFYRGVINNNYVSFADHLWRIIRINGDGSYRLILEGVAGMSLFYSTTSTTSNNTDYASSVIKTFLENWYTENIEDYEEYIDKNAIFWHDRSYTSANNTTSARNFNGRTRMNNSPPTPTLVPVNESDMFSVSGATKGNGLLSKPIGLITADEVVFAGGSYNYGGTTTYYSNESFYLFTDLGSNKVYGIWTMTPARWNKSTNTYSTMIVSKPQAVIYYEPPGISTRSVRPVINLKSTVTFSGSGTVDEPYKVENY